MPGGVRDVMGVWGVVQGWSGTASEKEVTFELKPNKAPTWRNPPNARALGQEEAGALRGRKYRVD